MRLKERKKRQITRCLWEASLPQIRLRRTSQTPKTLSEMPAVALMEDDKDVEFG